MILPLLTNIFFISDMIKKDENLKEIYKFLFNTVLTISDQEWVIERMFQICQSDRDIEEFNTGFFGKDSLGQYLLRIALRRKSERETKMELVNSKGSKKALIDKLFSVLTIWNLRASYCDLKVMIKDVGSYIDLCIISFLFSDNSRKRSQVSSAEYYCCRCFDEGNQSKLPGFLLLCRKVKRSESSSNCSLRIQ